MQNHLHYINLSWAVVGICEGSHLPLSALVHEGNDMEETVKHYAIGSISSCSVSILPQWSPTA